MSVAFRGGPQVGEREMASAHPSTIRDRHDALDQRIIEELSHPSSSDLDVARMKKEKLALRDAMEGTGRSH